MIHLYAPPGDFPATLCGLNRTWREPYAAVYGKDIARVNCPQCLGRVPSWQCHECGHPRGHHLHEATCGHEGAHEFDGPDVAGLMNTYQLMETPWPATARNPS